MKNKFFAHLAFAIIGISLNAFAQDTALKDRRELAIKIMQANQQAVDPKKLVAAMVEPMKVAVISSLKRVNPDLSEAYYNKVSEVVAREASAYMDGAVLEIFPSMIQSMADLYAKNFTMQELNELLKIYENPLMKKGVTIAIDGLPKLMTPYMQSMQLRAQLLGPRISQALAREGLLPPPKP
jgi:hypothetical protein